MADLVKYLDEIRAAASNLPHSVSLHFHHQSLSTFTGRNLPRCQKPYKEEMQRIINKAASRARVAFIEALEDAQRDATQSCDALLAATFKLSDTHTRTDNRELRGVRVREHTDG